MARDLAFVVDALGRPFVAWTDASSGAAQVYLRGNQGEALSNQSVDAVRDMVANTPAPPGVKAYVTGAAPLGVFRRTRPECGVPTSDTDQTVGQSDGASHPSANAPT